MTTEEIDYSLPYEEYLKNFRKTHHPQERAMSRDQYKAAAEKQAKMKAAEEAGTANWWIQEDGPAAKVLQEATGKENPTEEDVQKSIQGIIDNPYLSFGDAKGNQGDDHINHPNSLDTSDITKLGKKELASVQTEDNMNPATYSISNDDRVQMMKDAGISPEKIENEVNTTISDSVSDVATPKKDDPPGVIDDKNKYNKAMMSIWDAYRAGEISKETAGYFTIDAIATLAKNLGRSIGNVGAQFSGGTIDNGHDESKWGQRQNALLNEEIGKETESLGGAAGRQAESENIANLEARIRAEYSPKMLDLEIKNLENEVKKSGIDVTKAENSQALIEHIKQDPDYEKSLIKKLLVGFLSQTGVGGAVNTGASALEKLALLRGK